MGRKTIKIENCSIDKLQQLVGAQDRNAKLIEMHYHLEVNLVDDSIVLSSDDNEVLNKAGLVFETLSSLLEKGYQLDENLVMQVVNLADNDQLQYFFKLNEVIIGKTKSSKVICPKTLGQLEYVNALNKYDITFGIGPAGTGKTYLAVVNAVTMLKQGKVRKIILTRPAVEAGENLGFLPGDLKEKVDPYLRPLYDALYDMLGEETAVKMMEKGVIEVAPLAYMRGRTLEDAYIILDESQNATLMQLKMFLTRLGFKSKMVITGDASQIDLRSNQSGLLKAKEILNQIKNIGFVTLTSKDVSRHPLVQAIIDAFEEKGY